MTGNPFFDAAEANTEHAISRGLPPFLTDVGQSSPVNATPYFLHYGRFLAEVERWPGGRHRLAWELDAVKARVEALDFDIEAMLIGGSFTELSYAKPSDVDCLIFYRCRQNADPSLLADVQRSAKARQVDCRFVPLDGDPLVLLKLTSYFTILYSKRKSANEIVRCLLLLDCRQQ